MRGHRKVINSNFSAGELDPRLVPMRSDIQAWQQGAKRMVNMRPLLHGGVSTRPGTTYITQLNGPNVLFPFEFSETQAYILAVRDSAIDIFHHDGTFSQTVATIWTIAVARELRYTQTGDVMIFTHKTIPTYMLRRIGFDNFQFIPFEFAKDPLINNLKFCPFYRFASPLAQIDASQLTGMANINATHDVFTPAHVGTLLRKDGKQMFVTSYTNPRLITVDIVQPLTVTTMTHDWDEEAFSVVHGYPQAVCFHNERLVFGGSRDHPSGIWASQVGDFFNFDLADGSDDKAIWIGVAADKVVEVLHLASFKHLTVFTDQVEMYQPEGDSQPWSPKTAAIRQQSGFGCAANIAPKRFDDAVIFVQKHGQHVREFLYDAVSQSYSSDAVSVMNPSRIDKPTSIAVLTAARDIKEQYAFITMQNGGMAVLHSLRAQRITAWSWWETDGLFNQVCTVNGDVFVVAQRFINGQWVYYLERFDWNVLYAVDAYRAYAVTRGGTTASGVTYLEGRVAQAINGGYAYNPDIIQGGVYTISTDDEWVQDFSYIGLPFRAVLESMPPEIQTEEGSSRGRPLRIVKAGVQVHESIQVEIENGEGVTITNINDDYSIPPDPQSGMYDFTLLGFEKGRTVTVICDVPLQLTVLGLALEVVA